jgi:putative oxidoreductase
VAIITEFCGGLGLVVGLLGHVAAFGILVNTIVAVAMVHSRVGFFMNWTGNRRAKNSNITCWHWRFWEKREPRCRRR